LSQKDFSYQVRKENKEMMKSSKLIFPLLMELSAPLFLGCSQVIYPRVIAVKMDDEVRI
jgi:hypothetical protein